MKRLASILILFLWGCGDSPSPPSKASAPTTDPGVSGRISVAEGGTVGQQGSAQVEFHANALQEDVTVEIKKVDPKPFEAASTRVVGPVWSIQVNQRDDYEFEASALVRLPYDPSKILPGWPVHISWWTGDRWEKLASGDTNALRRTVEGHVKHFCILAPTSPAENPVVIGRWRGSTREVNVYPEYVSDRVQWGHTGHTDTREFKWSAREEYSEYLNEVRIIVESAAWAVSLGASDHSEGVTGDRQLPRFQAVDVGGSWGEGELNRFLTAEQEASLADKSAKLDELRRHLREIHREYDEAPASTTWASDQERMVAESEETIRRIKLEGEHDSIKYELEYLEGEVERLKFKSSQEILSVTVDRKKEHGTGRDLVGIRAMISSDPKYTGFTRDVWSCIRLTSGLMGEEVEIEHKKSTQEWSLSLNGHYVEAPPAGPWRGESETGPGPHGHFKTVSEYFGSGDPGTMFDLTVRGSAFHRVFVPKTDADVNVITSAGPGADISGQLVPVAGVAVLKAWITPSSTPPEGLRDFQTTTGDDGAFTLRINVSKKDYLHLALVYKNTEAQLKETCTISIRGKDLYAARDSQTGDSWSVPFDLKRLGKAVVRYARATKELDLGADDRPATLRKKDNSFYLDFDGPQVLLVNTFCLATQHFNQMTQKLPVQLDVPVERLLELCPPTRLDDVRRRLDAAVTNGKTTVTFAEYVTCQPSCCTMALTCLGFQAGLVEVAQATYDHLKANDGKPDAPPWQFPIPTQPEKWKAYREFMETFDPVEATPEDTADWKRAAAALDSEAFDSYWPYVDASSYTKQQWLANQEDGGYRVWQNATYFRPALEAKYAPNLSTSTEGSDVFSSANTPRVLNRLGAGRPAAVSIDHLSRERDYVNKVYVKDMGGHLILMLGAIVGNDGAIQRLIFHDPYGDLTRTPGDEGYHDPAWLAGGAEGDRSDVDKRDHWGAYAPYYPPDVKSWDGRLYSKYWTVFRRTDEPQTPLSVRKRMLSGE